MSRKVLTAKLVVFIMALASLGLLIDAALARVIVLKGTHTRGQVEIACTKADGASTPGKGHGGLAMARKIRALRRLQPSF
jgi:hypothetical protein